MSFSIDDLIENNGIYKLIELAKLLNLDFFLLQKKILTPEILVNKSGMDEPMKIIMKGYVLE